MLGFRTYRTTDDEVQIAVTKHVQEMQLNDWILDGCFQNQTLNDANPKETRFNALLVTAHNELHMLSFDIRKLNSEAAGISCRIASGPCSILYSAHVIWPMDSRVLVAAGTVFGEVLLWSYQTGGVDADGIGLLCHKFVGHEGSVFDVRISELQQSDTKNGFEQRVLASCSDDRTIRIWDITVINTPDGEMVSGMDKVSNEAGFSSLTTSTGSLAMVMGHASRIWGLRFFGQRDGSWEIISHGEDGTAQVWRLSSEAVRNQSNQARPTPELDLEHQATYSYHSRKNVWGIAEHLEPSNVAIVATGGADGRIATYKLNCQGSDASSNQCDMIETSRTSALTSQSPLSVPTGRPRTITRRIFDGLQGRWKLTRRIQSRSSVYPSGVLEGTATFESRCPSDEASSAEYLYSEIGEFLTRDGLAMKATRKYVYRYNENRDKITVWFVKIADDSTVDYFFHDLHFRDLVDSQRPRVDEDTGIVLSANGHHLCDKDDYTVEYGFVLSGSTLKNWTSSFNVQGPSKDYTTNATYAYENQHSTPKSGGTTTPIVQSMEQSTAHGDLAEKARNKKSFHPRSDSFKAYAWLSEKEMLTSTEQGNLLVGTVNTWRKPEDVSTMTWEHVSQQPLLRSSCIATSIVTLGICFLTGMEGTIFLYEHSRRNIKAVHSLRGKAGFLKAHRLSRRWNYVLHRASEQTVIAVFATCLGYSVAALLFLYSDRESSVLSVEKEYSLELPASFTVTSSCFLDNGNLFIIGSRSGALAIYNISKSFVDSAGHTIPQYFPNVHGQDAVTVIETVPESLSAYRSYILTAGRNGSYVIHQVIFDELQGSSIPIRLQTLHTGVPPFGPNIEGICIDADSLYLWGFRSTGFVVWNETEKTEAMTVNCGGAHRNWAYRHQRDGRGGGSLVYTKASVCHLHSQKQAFHQVMQQGGHGREIKALALSSPTKDDSRELRLLATGAEDTAIRIFDARSSVEGFRCLSIITKHTTGLQKLQWSQDERLLFSAAGCEEFFVWRLQPVPLITVGVVCEAQCPRVTEEADLRIMDFAGHTIPSETIASKDGEQGGSEYLITMVYSDSSIRVFRYSTDTKTFALITSGTYTAYCLTQAAYIYSIAKLCICTASTDGHLAFWSVYTKTDAAEISEDPINVNPLLSPNPTTITHNKRIRIHQNSIKSILTLPLPQNSTLIITAGDDGALAFTHLHIPLDETATHSILRLPKAHASAITALAHLGELKAGNDRSHRFASVGNDQRLKTWAVHVEFAAKGLEGLRVVKEKDMSTSVADASSLDVGVDEGGERRLYVAGIGMERWRVGDQGISPLQT